MTALTSVLDVDLVCLGCGRGRQLTVAALVDLPALPERWTVCSGSVLAVAAASRVVRADLIVKWPKLRTGRPPSPLKPPTQGVI